ncbi:ATP-binding protein [Bacillus carboniphilus]|uniref:histidine kinase n=1 Tax=Bacillus carboniphilus TaxID=86663 RepID=A0ABY9K2N1_9BACI|nr:ATP-binding protein [Bacillus carboniphilus]WLR44161.1 ATP-binding protein [Bacillus carboniphilus]
MHKFRTRLLFGLLTLIIAVLIGLGILIGQLFQTYYIDTYKDRIKKEAELTETLVLKEGIDSTNLQPIIETISEQLESNVAIINSEGAIVTEALYGEKSPYYDRTLEQLLGDNRNKKKSFYEIRTEDDLFFYGMPIINDSDEEGFIVLSLPVSSLKLVNQQIWGLLIISLGLALIVILIIGVRITSQYTKPIESATQVAMELAKGNYKARTYENHLDETGMLSQSINILARNLQDMTKAQEMQQDRLQTLIENMGSGLILIDGRGYINLVNRAYKEIFQIDENSYLYKLYYEAFEHEEIIDIVEEIFMTEVGVRRQLMVPLKIERRHFEVYGVPIIGNSDEWKGVVLVFHDITELKKLEQMRKDFVANVSHELKTPITSIKGFSETLLDGAMNERETLTYFLSIILKESDRLQSLIQDLLDLSKIEQQGFELNIEKCDFKEILDEIIMLLEQKAKAKDINLNVDNPYHHVYLQGDPDRLKQIFINLIGNAINYTLEGGQVFVTVKNLDDQVVVTVKDTGIGMKEEEIPRIFERFYRVDKARSRDSGGTGLGLAIVKHLVEAHHADIFVTSHVGEGTTFTITFNKEGKHLLR